MRKRSTGRARSGTSLYVSIERANKKLKKLKQSGKLGHYASKELLAQFRHDSNIKINRSSRSYILKIKTTKLKPAQIRYYQKALDTFIKNKSSSVMGIKDIESKKRKTLKETLTQLTDKDITDADIEDFYDLVDNDDYNYFAEKVPDSLEIYIILNEAKEKNLNEDGFIELLKQFMSVNSEETRERAKRLYNKWVA